MRKPIVAGQFYDATKTELIRQLESCFKHNLGPGMPRVPVKEEKIYGIISPHAGYIYSGPCASYSYKELAELNKTSFPETFIILGPNHQGAGNSLFALSLENFETPLGVVSNDTEFGAKLIEKTSHLGLENDEQAHQYEHSLEVQLPFLQFISGLVKKQPMIVPIIISTQEYDKCLALGRKIAEIAQEMNKNICVVASSDMTHYGVNYGFLPFPHNQETKTKLKELDRKSINHILKLNSDSFYKEAIKTTICGTTAIVTAIEACKVLGSKKANFLKYYTSGDILKDYTNAVGYASLVFK